MNTTRLITTLSLALGATFAGSAFADGATYDYPQQYSAAKTRAQVQAEYLQARAAGQVTVGEASLPANPTFVAQKSRSQVHAETLAAIANGELRTTNMEFAANGRVQPLQSSQPDVVTAAKR